ncbi:MAG TPA: phenylalanine--tRNA ligase subunit beta [Solimonas sp.]|nr:phenylalanine--tRNA ligase subunit beta [Solimonas sp.]
MKLSENWLREWVNPPAAINEIADRLVMGGLELEIDPVLADLPQGVVVGRITKAERHPQADRLQVCEVDVGQPQKLQIVCGAANARAGMNAPCAVVGAKLPDGMEIKQAQLRGVDSFGMLCSAKELGLAEKSEGLLELDADAKPGTPIEQYLGLKDNILNLEITPNRGDCLSVLGLARELSALYAIPMKRPNFPQGVVVGHTQLKVEIEDLQSCPHYTGRVITRINPKALTPDWMRERLRRAGLRCIHPVVDITNYVMLELGQPMHAFDSGKISGNVRVRRARAGEQLKLLNGEALEFNHGELLIADDHGPLALAGVMGGEESGVAIRTTGIFLESACFAPTAVAGTARRHKLGSDSSYRFERGVDPNLQRMALERATQLILQICGGEVHPVVTAGRPPAEPVSVRLRQTRLNQLLGHEIGEKEVEQLLSRLGITTRHEIGGAWIARVPSYRYDLRIEPDLIEEVARLYGYDRIPAKGYAARLAPGRPREGQRSLKRVQDVLVARGWQEIVSLAFTDPKLLQRLAPEAKAVPLDNPMAEQISVMRSSLWPGLVQAWLYNRQRQQSRLRLFESGVAFEDIDGAIRETPRLAGLAVGNAVPEQWSSPARPMDFYDLKDDVVALFGSAAAEYRFDKATHPALHPGQSARILRGETPAGWIGALHPSLVRELDLPQAPLLFELDWPVIRDVAVPQAQPLSEFPSSRRDLALVVPEAVSAEALNACIRGAGEHLLQKVFIFDIYRGKNLPDACKSVALGLIFNDYSRTLTLEEIDAAVAGITAHLMRELGAVIRH